MFIHFFSSNCGYKEQNCRIDRDYAVEGDVSRGGMLLEEVSLVVRKPGSRVNKPAQNRDGTSTWKGKIVKNFKKFRKVDYLTSTSQL